MAPYRLPAVFRHAAKKPEKSLSYEKVIQGYQGEAECLLHTSDCINSVGAVKEGRALSSWDVLPGLRTTAPWSFALSTGESPGTHKTSLLVELLRGA